MSYYKPTRIIIHHEAASNGFHSVNHYHKMLWNFKSELGFFIGYQYYIDETGKVWQGRSDTEEGAHTKGMNNGSIGICLEGNLDSKRPTFVQLTALKSLINEKMRQYNIPANNIAGHRMFQAKSCPGDLISERELKEMFQPDLSYIQAMILEIRAMIQRMKVQLGSSWDHHDEKD